MHSREQQWAQVASRLVAARSEAGWREDYGRLCLHLPAMLHSSGLCQTLAFLEAKAKDDQGNTQGSKPYYGALLDDLAAALEYRTEDQSTARQRLVKTARTAPLTEYLQASRNAVQCASYFKRYAEAILKVELSDDPPDGERV